MKSKYLYMACYSAICTSFLMKLVNKFRMSFRSSTKSFEGCPPPYTAVHFLKEWSANGKAYCRAKSLILGPELKTPEARQELYRYCSTIEAKDGYAFNHASTISTELPDGFRVGDTSALQGIVSQSDIYHIVGKYYELMAKEK